MAGDGPGEGVLGVGVHVHLDDTIAEGFFDLLLLGAGATVEDKVEGQSIVGETELGAAYFLAFEEHFGT